MNKLLIVTLVLGAGILTSACALQSKSVASAALPGQLEAIHGAAFTRDTMLLKVSSNGCTDKDDIKPFITKMKSRVVMTLRRLEEDTCRNTGAEGVLLRWSFDELGLEPGTQVEVNNPYLTPRNAS